MGHISMPWDGDAGLGGIGDCGPYSSEEWSHYLASMVLLDPNYGGVFWSYLATNPSAGVVRLSNGAGIVRGRVVETDSYTDFTPSTPVANTRKDRIVLRSDYTAQTIRPVYRENSVEGADYETLQQTAGVLWEVPLWKVQITTGGAITLTDDRERALRATGILNTVSDTPWAATNLAVADTYYDIDGLAYTIRAPYNTAVTVHVTISVDGPLCNTDGTFTLQLVVGGVDQGVYTFSGGRSGPETYNAHWTVAVAAGTYIAKISAKRSSIASPDIASFQRRQISLIAFPIEATLAGVL